MASTSFYDQLDERISRVIADPKWQPADSAEASETDTSLGELLAVAADLRMMPSSDFKAKLKADLVGARTAAVVASRESERRVDSSHAVRRRIQRVSGASLQLRGFDGVAWRSAGAGGLVGTVGWSS